MRTSMTMLQFWTIAWVLLLQPLQHQSLVGAFQHQLHRVSSTSTRGVMLQRPTFLARARIQPPPRTTALSLVVDSDVDPIVRKRRLATAMAYLTGVSDVALSLQFQTFATMLTGNLMWLSRAVVERNLGTTLYYVSVFMSYMTGLSLVRLMRKREPKTILKSTGAAVMALFVGADFLFYGAGFSRWIPVCLLAMAFGGINSIGTDFAGTLTFVVTGHVTRLTHLVTDCCVERKEMTEADITAAKQCVAVTGGFFAGALTAFLLLTRNMLLRQGLWTTLGMGYGLLFFSYDGRRIKRWWKRRQVPEMMVTPPTIEVVETSDTLSEKDAVAAAVNDAISEEKDVVVVVVHENATLAIASGGNSTLSIANGGNATLPVAND